MNNLAISLVGDPTLLGWSLTACYGLSALACVYNARRQQQGTQWFWVLLAGLLFLMAINKQADWHQVLRDVARPIVLEEGWQDYRRVIQAVAILLLAGVVIVASITMGWQLRHRRDLWWTAGGALAVALFVILRAATFYHVFDVWLKMPWVMTFVTVFEWVGPLLVLTGALHWARATLAKR